MSTSVGSITSEHSHIPTETTAQEEEQEISLPTETAPVFEQRKPKPVSKILFGEMPANPKYLELQLYVHDPNYDKIMIGTETKGVNIKFLFIEQKLYK